MVDIILSGVAVGELVEEVLKIRERNKSMKMFSVERKKSWK